MVQATATAEWQPHWESLPSSHLLGLFTLSFPSPPPLPFSPVLPILPSLPTSLTLPHLPPTLASPQRPVSKACPTPSSEWMVSHPWEAAHSVRHLVPASLTRLLLIPSSPPCPMLSLIIPLLSSWHLPNPLHAPPQVTLDHPFPLLSWLKLQIFCLF